MTRVFALVLAALSLAVIAPLTAQATPPGTMNYQGVLRDAAGAPVVVSTQVTFSIWDADTGGTMLWTETVTVAPTAGVFDVVLGLSTALDPEDFSAGPLWLELQVTSEPQPLTPRQELTSVPWAQWSARADVALALDPSAPTTDRVPLGGIIDWYAFSASDPVPDGYAICDGTAVSDPASPFLGQTLPDLVDRVAMGVATPGATGTTGGNNMVTYGPTTNTLVNSIGGAAGNVVAAAMSTSAPSRDFFTSGAWNGTNQRPGTTGGSGTLTSTEARPFNDPTGADVTYTGTSTGSLTSSSTALTTDSASAANTGSWSGTTDSDGASNTGSAGSVTFDNRSAWVGLLKIMRIR